jgi:hypothetical protein
VGEERFPNLPARERAGRDTQPRARSRRDGPAAVAGDRGGRGQPQRLRFEDGARGREPVPGVRPGLEPNGSDSGIDARHAERGSPGEDEERAQDGGHEWSGDRTAEDGLHDAPQDE